MSPTGEKIQTPGVYSNDCHNKKVMVSRSQPLPNCPDCRQPANWRLVSATV
jgi:hypothetical protein